MHDFSYIKGALHCERVPVNRIAKACGTPVYVYSRATLERHYTRLDEAFASVPHRICYSVKSNSNLAVCRLLARRGAGFDVVSEGELRRALRAGAKPGEIVFAGVGKTADEIAYAVKKGILFFTVESLPELEQIGTIARKLRRTARIGIRVNPGVDAHTHDYITTGKEENKFGLDSSSALEAYRRAMKLAYVEPVAVQMHIGSQITETGPYVEAIRQVRPLIDTLKHEGMPIRFFDIGGGLGIIYRDEKPSTARRFAAAVLPEVKGLGMELIIEPGRFIAGNAGILVTRVLYVKKTPVKNFVIVDAGMNDLIRPSLYEAYHEVRPVKRSRRKKIVADIVGPICESGDFLAKDRELPLPEEGDLLAVLSSGAYGFTMSSNYNSRCRAAEVLVHGSHYDVVRERERYSDLMRGEWIPGYLCSQSG